MVLGLFFIRAMDESRNKTSAEMDKRITFKILDLPLGLYMFNLMIVFGVWNGRECREQKGEEWKEFIYSQLKRRKVVNCGYL